MQGRVHALWIDTLTSDEAATERAIFAASVSFFAPETVT